MSYNYRLIITDQGTEDQMLAIHEVFYNDDGSINMWTENPCSVGGETAGEVASTLVQMAIGVHRPVLIEVDEKLVEVKS